MTPAAPPGTAPAAGMSSPSGSGRGRGGGGRGRQKSSWAAVASGAGSPGSRAGAARDVKGQATTKSLSTKKVESTTTALALGIIKDQLVEADAEQRLLERHQAVHVHACKDGCDRVNLAVIYGQSSTVDSLATDQQSKSGTCAPMLVGAPRSKGRSDTTRAYPVWRPSECSFWREAWCHRKSCTFGQTQNDRLGPWPSSVHVLGAARL